MRSRGSIVAYHGWWTAVALVALAAACTDSPVTPTAPREPASEDGVILSRAGIPVPLSRMNTLLGQITREVAIALADAHLRGQVYAALNTSPYREHKLDFNSYLRADASPLLSAMAAARRGPAGPAPTPTAAQVSAAVLATLDSIIDLEFYMPVPEHRAAWSGDNRLLVAGALDDHDVPMGFNLAGEPVLLRQDQPPDIPTLVVVRNETNFASPKALASFTEPARSPTVEQPGVYMTSSTIIAPGSYEGWSAGNPEFEIHSYVQNDNGLFVDQICSGEEQSGMLRFDQNGSQFNGRVLTILQTGIGTHQVEFQVWENDVGACTPSGGGRPPSTTSDVKQELANFAARVIQVILATGPLPTVLNVLLGLPALYNLVAALNHDDLVGVASFAGPQNGCWPETGPAPFNIVRPTGAIVGTLALDVTYGVRSPICAFTVSWEGTGLADPNTQGAWEARGQYGTTPYTFRWYRDGTLVATGSTYAANVGTTAFRLRIDGTDALGANASSTRWVTITDPNALTVSLTGPSMMGPYDVCSFTATAAYGVAPYTYSWQGGAQVETSWGSSFYSTSAPASVSVLVTDAEGHEASAGAWADVDENIQGCH